MVDTIGGFAALFAALSFSVASTMFTLSGRQFGPLVALRASLPLGFVCLLVIRWLVTGQPFPLDIEGWRWLWLGASGIIGFWLSFTALINAFVRIGPRLTLLIGAVSPILSTVLAWQFLDQSLDVLALFGIMLTLGGIVWVVSDRRQTATSTLQTDSYGTGILFALAGAFGQACALVLSSRGLQGDFDPSSGSLIRLLSASVAIWLFTLLHGQVRVSLRALRSNPVALRQISVATVIGPVIGASLVLVSLQHVPVGVTNTLMSLTPIFLIPISYVVFKERITRRAVAGTMVAITGTVLLFF